MTPINVDDCSAYNYSLANFSLFHEDNPTSPLNGTISATFTFTFISGVVNLSLSKPNVNQLRVCSDVENTTISSTLYLQDTVDTGFAHRFYLYNFNFNQSNQAFSLYNFNYTSGISILQLTVRDYLTNDPYPDIIVKLQRYYPGTGIWLTVQEYRTDVFGLAIFDIIEQFVDYRFIFTDTDNNILATTTAMAFSCTAWSAASVGICQLTYQLDTRTVTADQVSIGVTRAYNVTTNSINLTWTDPTGSSDTVVTLITRQSYTGTVTICNSTQYAASGVVNCPTFGYSGPVLITVVQNGETVISEYVELNSSRLGEHLDPYEGAFWSGMISLVCFGFGVAVSPASAIIALIVGLIAIYAMGIFSGVTLTFLIIAVVLGIAVGWRLRS